MSASIYLDPYRPLTLLPTNQISDFSRNFREMQKHAKRPYSLTRVLRSFCTSPPKLDGFEVEVDEELKALNRGAQRGRSAGPARVVINMAAGPITEHATGSNSDDCLKGRAYPVSARENCMRTVRGNDHRRAHGR